MLKKMSRVPMSISWNVVLAPPKFWMAVFSGPDDHVS
jgi:hypothetical protein